jgi:hypothetical protein
MIASEMGLREAGYTKKVVPAEWEDTGGPESGPMLSGHNGFDLWELHNAYVVVVDGKIVDNGYYPPQWDDCGPF